MTDIIPPGNQALAQLKLNDVPENDYTAMTEKQAAVLRQLCKEKGAEFDASLTSAQAEERIAALEATD